MQTDDLLGSRHRGQGDPIEDGAARVSAESGAWPTAIGFIPDYFQLLLLVFGLCQLLFIIARSVQTHRNPSD